MKRVLVIGDIHGQLDHLDAMLDFLAPTAEDVLIFLGDYVDRGPKSKEVIDRLIGLQEQFPQTIFLKGNHEEMLIESLDSKSNRKIWEKCGGRETLKSYGMEFCGTITLPWNHLNFFKSLKTYHEATFDRPYLFVHASYDPDTEPSEFSGEILRWETPETRPHVSGCRVVCGHMPKPHPTLINETLMMDLGCGKSGRLGAVDLLAWEFWATLYHPRGVIVRPVGVNIQVGQ